MDDIIIRKNSIQLTHSRLLKPGFVCGIYIPNGNAEGYSLKLANAASLNNVNITNNNIYASLPDAANDKTAGMILHSLQNSFVKDNIISGMNYAGIFLMGSKWGMNNLAITNNRFIDFKPNNNLKVVAGYIVATDTYSSNKRNAPGFKKIAIEKNNFSRTKKMAYKKTLTGKSRGKFLGAFIALPGYMLNEIKFLNNTFSNAEEKIVSVNTD